MSDVHISVVMPVYNAARWLRACIDSVLKQTATDLEFIAVDDGSTDESPDILATYARLEPRIQVVRQPNQGQPAALNVGLRRARGTYVGFLDPDDEVTPDRLEVQRRFLDLHPSIGAVGCGVELIDEAGRVLGRMTAPVGAGRCRERVFSGRYYNLGGALLVRREAAIGIGGFRSPFRWNDLDFLLRLAERHEIDNVRDVLYRYRLHGSSESTTLAARGVWERRVIYEMHQERVTCGTDRLQRGDTVIVPEPGTFEGTTATIEDTLAYIQVGEVDTALEEGRFFAAMRAALAAIRYASKRRQMVRALRGALARTHCGIGGQHM